MGTTIKDGAAFGVGVYGVDAYGVSGVTYIPDGLVFTTSVGVVSVSTTLFDFNAVKELYEVNRTAYVEGRTNAESRFIYVDKQPRIVYVDAPVNVYRTASVGV